MADLWIVAAAAAAGAALGLAYFTGLWATVRVLPASRHPALLMAVSFAVRFLLAAVVFVVLARRGGWAPVMAALGGFAVARLVLVRQRLREAERTARRGRAAGDQEDASPGASA